MGGRQYNSLVYVLFLIVVIGAFASMAQNEYGIILLSAGCFGFSLLFLTKLWGMKRLSDTFFPKPWLHQELIVMSLIMFLFGLRALRIRFSFVEIVFVISAILMMYIYARYLLRLRNTYQNNQRLAFSIYLIYGAILLFFASMSITFLNQSFSTLLGAAGFALTAGFWLWYFSKGPSTIFKEERVLLMPELFRFNNLSAILMTVIILMSVYVGLNKIKLIPDIYTGELPVRFIDLQEKAVRGELKPVDGIFKHDIYWEEYQKFLTYMRDKEK